MSREKDDLSAEIDGGTVEYVDSAEPKWNPIKHRSVTASRLTWVLVFIFGISVFVHYGALLWLYNHGMEAAAEKMATHFNVLFPVLSGLLGAATTYYFTREREE